MAAFKRCSEHGAGRSMDGLEQDAPATVKSRRCGAASPYRELKTRAGRPCPISNKRLLRSAIHDPQSLFIFASIRVHSRFYFSSTLMLEVHPPSFRASTTGPWRVRVRA
jgi:hypothetical protein